jgi:hypothetical protein
MDDYSYDTFDSGYDGGFDSSEPTYDSSYDAGYGTVEDGGYGSSDSTGCCCDSGQTAPTELPPAPDFTPDGTPTGYGDGGSYDGGFVGDGTQSPAATPVPTSYDPLPAPPPPPTLPQWSWEDPGAAQPGTPGFDVAQVPPGFNVAQVPPAAPWPEATPVFSPIATPYGNPIPTASAAAMATATSSASSSTAVLDPMAAEVNEDMGFWFRQGSTYSCGPASVSQIIEDFTGADLNNEWDVFNYADGQGWIEHGKGMTINDLEKTIDAFGVDSSVSTGSLLDADRLAESGHGVVLFVDGAKYWPDHVGGAAPHFARLLDVDWAKGTALMSDSWTGGPLEVSIGDLTNAWNTGGPDGGSKMLVTNGTDPDGVGTGTVGAGAPVRF